jgi:hypothetical protein
MTLISRFKRGKYNEDMLKEMLPKLVYVDDSLNSVVLSTYWNTQMPMSKLSDPENWEIFKTYENSILSPQFDYVMQHRSEFSKFGTDVVEKVIYGKAATAMEEAGERADSVTFKKAYNMLSHSNDADVQQYAAFTEAMYYKELGQWKTFAEKAEVYAEKYPKDASGLNELAWSAFKGTKDNNVLNLALTWAKTSVDNEKGFANLDTYANLLYANRKYAEAKAAAEESVKLGKEAGEATGDTEALLDRIAKAMK